MSLFYGNRGTKLKKLEDENMVCKFFKMEQIRKTFGDMGTGGNFGKEQGSP